MSRNAGKIHNTIADIIPAERVEHGGLAVLVDLAWAVFYGIVQYVPTRAAACATPWNKPIIEEHPGPPLSLG